MCVSIFPSVARADKGAGGSEGRREREGARGKKKKTQLQGRSPVPFSKELGKTDAPDQEGLPRLTMIFHGVFP